MTIKHKTSNFAFSIEGGFTFIEIMVAMSIIAVVLVSVYRLHSQTLSMSNDTKFNTTGPFLAQKKLAEIELDTDGMSDASGDFGEDFEGYTWQVTIEDMDAELLGDSGGYLKKIDLHISWNNDEFSYDVRTYRFVVEE